MSETDLEQLDNIWMVQSLHDSNFTEKFLKTPGIKLSFVDDFYRNLEGKKEITLKATLLIKKKIIINFLEIVYRVQRVQRTPLGPQNSGRC